MGTPSVSSKKLYKTTLLSQHKPIAYRFKTTMTTTTETPIYTETYYPWFFFPYSVTVTKDKVSFGYYFWLFTKTVDRSEIAQVQPLYDVKGFREWGGWGIRLRPNEGHWETGYIAKNGGAVQIQVHDPASDKDSFYVFTCSEPKNVSEILSGM